MRSSTFNARMQTKDCLPLESRFLTKQGFPQFIEFKFDIEETFEFVDEFSKWNVKWSITQVTGSLLTETKAR